MIAPARQRPGVQTRDATMHCDPGTRDTVRLGVRQALAALADPTYSRWSLPNQAAPSIRWGPRSTPAPIPVGICCRIGSCAPPAAAFVEDITETARTLAARSADARLDAPLLLALDEIANLTPLPTLPSLLAESDGWRITTLAVLQAPGYRAVAVDRDEAGEWTVAVGTETVESPLHPA